ncbi:MAG TPA: DUF3577 domain-containing protein [Planctomycetes bacterium]|nr:DUF3577 domain-containing protein [Planctomycetota bacterium]
MSHTEKKFFNLHIDGIGYFERAREVTPKRGEPFMAVAVNALHGAADAVQRVRFDCTVRGQEAERLVREHMDAINDRDAKVLVGFRLGDLYAETFTYEKGDRAGETGVSLKARLLRVEWLKIDGETVYQRPRQEASPDGETPTQSEEASPTEPEPLPAEVRLSKDDPDFEAKKAKLKEQGYRFVARDKVWRLPKAAA